MKDIAEDLGVSAVTISKVLRGHSDISRATTRRVMKRVKELNYQPNWIARSLVTKRTWIIGLVIPDLMHSFFAEIAKGVSLAIRPKGYHLLISNTEGDESVEKLEIETLMARRVDGLIIASRQSMGETDLFERLRSSGAPFILVERRVRGVDAPFVGWEQADLGTLATEHLFECGCRRIAHIRGPEIETGIGRMEGYRKALQRHGLEPSDDYIVSASYGDGTGYDAMKRLLSASPRPDGVFCYKDPVAACAIRAILEAGLNVPEDIAVIGVGNIQYSDFLRVPLSTIDQSSRLMGERAAELLMRLMDPSGDRGRKVILIPPKLLARDSTVGRLHSTSGEEPHTEGVFKNA
jgi:LacI family transcriptional regulator